MTLASIHFAYERGVIAQKNQALARMINEKTIGDIAESVGFTMANFRIQFKQRYGMTPAEFREAQDKKQPA